MIPKPKMILKPKPVDSETKNDGSETKNDSETQTKYSETKEGLEIKDGWTPRMGRITTQAVCNSFFEAI